MKLFSIFAVAFCSINIEVANATLIQLDMQATVTGATTPTLQSTFANGQTAQISITYETTTPIQQISFSQAFRIDGIKKFSLTSGTYSTSIMGDMGQMVVYDNLSGTDGIQFQIAATSATYQFTNPKPATGMLANTPDGSIFDHFFVNLASNDTSLYNSYDLPTSYDLSDYPTTQNAIFRFNTGQVSMGFSNISASIVPEPSSMLCVLSGIAFCALRRRRN